MMIGNTNGKISYKSVDLQDVSQATEYPIQLVTDKEKIKEYHLKKLYQLSLKSLGENKK